MYIVGLTGGIGSGKTAAAERFLEHGVTIINSDQVAREVVAPDTEALAAIVKKFGTEVLQEDGYLNRAVLREVVFNNERHRKWLEQLTHPLVIELTQQRKNAPRAEHEAPYRILESPLLFEAGRHQEVNRILLIDTDETTQLERVMQRDNNDKQQILNIIQAQMPRQDKQKLAHDIIDNSKTLGELYQQIDRLHQLYCELAGKAQ